MRGVLVVFICGILSVAALADTLKAGGKSYSGMFAGYAKGQVQFQEWTATEPLQMELRRVERLKIAKPSPVKYTLSGAPKKILTAPFLGIKNGAFLFAAGDDELRYFSRQIGRIDVTIGHSWPRRSERRRARAMMTMTRTGRCGPGTWWWTIR
jgi:hypothetical protein